MPVHGSMCGHYYAARAPGFYNPMGRANSTRTSKLDLFKRAKKNRFKKRYVVCEAEACSQVYFKVLPRQKFCGSFALKKGCAYHHRLAQQAKWRKAHRSQVNVWQKKWEDANADKRRMQDRQFYLRHRARRLLLQKRIDARRLRKHKARQEVALMGRPMKLSFRVPFYKDSDPDGASPL